ncbi:uncharacterized protein RJT21DRAFT_27484 [Scheffersomyces amazonensis]|uniref:uncharacterized protein n=1 Tax=Scheffersomyces amazonensis TaxID=1078765 RepID=UPI00315C74B0
MSEEAHQLTTDIPETTLTMSESVGDSVDDILNLLKKDYSDVLSLKALGDQLRDETVRANPVIAQSLPLLTTIVSNAFTNTNNRQVQLEGLRVLINSMAFNDVNRSEVMKSDSETLSFWKCVSAELSSTDEEIGTRIVLLLSQFIYDTDHKNEYVKQLYQYGLYESTLNFLKSIDSEISQDVVAYDKHIELLHELIVDNGQEIAQDQASSVCRVIELLLRVIESAVGDVSVDATDEDYQSVLGRLFQTLAIVTGYSQIPNIDGIRDAFKRLVSLFVTPKQWITELSVRRSFVPSVTNFLFIESYTQGAEDLLFIIDVLKGIKNTPPEYEVDSYLICACVVYLGNYIHNEATASQVRQLIAAHITDGLSGFVSLILSRIKLTDVILVQSLHPLANLMNGVLAHTILQSESNYKSLLTYNKIILDNKDFYPEILSVYLKFIYKLIRHEFLLSQDEEGDHKSGVFEFSKLWKSIIDSTNDQLIQLYLIEAIITNFNVVSHYSSDNILLIRSLITSAMGKLDSSPQLEVTLQKLKAIGIFNHTLLSKEIGLDKLIASLYDKDCSMFSSLYLRPYYDFLIQLQQLSTNKQGHSSDDLILNNAKFIAGTSLPLFRDLLQTDATSQTDVHIVKQICTVCTDVTQL